MPTPRTSDPAVPARPRVGTRDTAARLASDQVGDEATILSLDVSRVDLPGHVAELVEWGDLRLSGGSLAASRWYKPHWHDLEVSGVDAANTRLEQAGVHRTWWRQCRLTGLDAAGSTLVDCDVESSALDLARFGMTKLRRARFVDCRMNGADFTGANLVDVTFVGCDLTEASLREVRCQRVRFENCELGALEGVLDLRGATISTADLTGLAPLFARAIGIRLD